MTLSWQAQDVLRAVRGQSLHPQDWTARGVSIDSRTTHPGDLFVAIKGDALDGHAYVHKAVEAGACAALVAKRPPQVPPDFPLIAVEDTFTALQDLGRVGRARSHAKIVAVTGSVGKTSSKEQLRLMLGSVKDTYATEGSLNNHWGVPLSLSRLPQDFGYGIFEIGMNHAGELSPLAREVLPHVALITNVEAVHLENFPSVEAIADAKAEIFLGMDPAGIAVINRDNPHFARLLAAARTQGLKKVLGFGRDPKSDGRLLKLTMDDEGSTIEAVILGEKITFRLAAPGAHLAFNALGTLLACAAANADIELCAEALSAYRPPQGRGTRQTIALSSGGSFTLIDETYNASPIATQAALALLGQTTLPPGGRRIAVLGDMRELGPTSPALHAGLAQKLVENKIDIVHCCGDMMMHLHAALPASMRGCHMPDSESLAPLVRESVQAGDAVLVKGSHSMHMEIITGALRALAAESDPARRCAG